MLDCVWHHKHGLAAVTLGPHRVDPHATSQARLD